jgi:nucleotide-binding universal stress UspA family protein
VAGDRTEGEIRRSSGPGADETLFPSTVCGVDGSAAGEEAVRQAALLTGPAGRLALVAVINPAPVAHAEAVAALRRQALTALGAVSQLVTGAGVELHVVAGDAAAGLLAAARRHGAALLAVGSHGTGRIEGIMTGSVATAVLHRAPCSVLVARTPRTPGQFPSRIVVGVDGSAASLQAVEVAESLARRFDIEVLVVAAAGAAMEVAEFRARSGLRIDERDPVDALVAAADEAALLVVGSRGLTGVRALGSVSERVAHRAGGSVLVVRGVAP